MYADYNFISQDSPACAQLLLVAFSYFGIEVTRITIVADIREIRRRNDIQRLPTNYYFFIFFKNLLSVCRSDFIILNSF